MKKTDRLKRFRALVAQPSNEVVTVFLFSTQKRSFGKRENKKAHFFSLHFLALNYINVKNIFGTFFASEKEFH